MNYRKILALLILNISAAVAVGNSKDWPCFHGPRRDNLSAETALLQGWPQNGPELLWTADGIGHGYSTVSIAGGCIYTAGMIDKQTYITALDLNGKQLWQKLNGQSWQASEQQTWAVPYAGSRGTPTVDGGVVYHLSELGRLAAFDAGTGDEKWHVDIMKTFAAERPEYGYSESVLIRGDALYCCPAGKNGYIAALDKKTGQTLWANKEITDNVGNGSAVVGSIGSREQIVTMSAQRVLGFDPNDGRLLWDYAFENQRGNNIADVIVSDDLVYASSGYGKGSVLLRPQRQSDGTYTVTEVWTSELLDNHHGGVLLFDGYLYGAGQEARGWFCLDFKTGDKKWQTPGKGSLTYADGHLYCLEERGTMSLVKAVPDKWEQVGSFRVPSGGEGLYWPHPVVCVGRLYIRHSDKLFAYKIGKN
ncbi:MAG: PQQ-like beta-propeller repeat protein [Sedimentisphaerales bacterium]|nr:PQQ-like beta-propeller repeat protein [Sedimentisphaerales bacterium]